LIYDLDDAIWHPQQDRKHHWLTNLKIHWRLTNTARTADLCCLANTVLESHVKRWNTRTVILPMALDGQHWVPRQVATSARDRLRVGWTGRGASLVYLQSIKPALVALQAQCPEVEFAVFSGERPALGRLQYTYIPYQAGREPQVVRSFDIGLLPLGQSRFAEGKSPIKGLQYMACALPSVVSPLGATRDMFRQGETALFAQEEAEWTQSLVQLVRNPDLRQAMSGRARRHFEQHYALSHTASRFAQILCAI
jgi:glycosyltransferase involved in cell wall biosynthesis